MEDKFKSLEYGVKILSSVAMHRKTSPLNTDDCHQNTVDSSVSYAEGKYPFYYQFMMLLHFI